MREPSSGAVVTEQRVRRRIQISGLNSTQLSQRGCVAFGAETRSSCSLAGEVRTRSVRHGELQAGHEPEYMSKILERLAVAGVMSTGNFSPYTESHIRLKLRSSTSVLLSLDISAAFDTRDHSIILSSRITERI